MKQILIILSSIIAFTAAAQTKGKGNLYAYQQTVTPGMVRKTLDENGVETAAPVKQNHSYRIYLVTASRAFPLELWIKGQRFSARVKTIEQTPVEQVNTNVQISTDKKVLVPKTSMKVIQLTPAPAVSKGANRKIESMGAANDLIVFYKQNGKFYYQAVPKMT